MMEKFDVIIIGGGHNGLVAAGLLAKAGKKVIVFEQRNILGGITTTEEILPGYKFNTGIENAGLFQPKINDELELENLEFIRSPLLAFAPQLNGKGLTIWRNDIEKTQNSIRQFSQKDAEKFPDYIKLLDSLTKTLKKILITPPPNPYALTITDILNWLPIIAGIRGLGKRNMMRLFRILPMTAQELMNEWFESKELQGLLGSTSVYGTMQGPQSSGTAFMMLYNQLGISSNGYLSSQTVKGGPGQLINALASAAKKYGAEIECNKRITKIYIEDDKAIGVEINNNEIVRSQIIVSSLDARKSLLELCPPQNLEPKIIRQVKNIKFRGSTAKVIFTFDGIPQILGATSIEELSGHIVICPDLEYLEKAYDNAKYGNVSSNPFLDITIPTINDTSLAPAGKHIMSIIYKFAPYQTNESMWEEEKDYILDNTIRTLSQYIPNLSKQIENKYVITPRDYELNFGLTEGSIYHGQMGLDQLIFMRPISGYAQYRSPIENLFFCGAGSHPGGGLTGAPGYNAAKEILKYS